MCEKENILGIGKQICFCVWTSWSILCVCQKNQTKALFFSFMQTGG